MKALLLWADDASPNLGVRVLAAGTTALLRRRWPDIEVDEYLRPYPDGPAPLRLGYGALAGGIARRKAPASRWFASYDLVVDTGGGDSFADIYGTQRLALISAYRLCAARSGTPTVLGPQTLGPFHSRRGNALARASLVGTRGLLARDSRSASYSAAALGREAPLATDVVFALPTDVAPRETVDVLFNVSGLLWHPNPHVDAAAYRNLCIDAVGQLVRRGLRVRLLCHVLPNASGDEDASACQAVLDALRLPELDMVVPTDLEDARAHIASAGLVVGARMHACLNALSLGVPALPLAYSRKFAPLMDDLAWSESRTLGEVTADRIVQDALRLLGERHAASEVAAGAGRRLDAAVVELERWIR